MIFLRYAKDTHAYCAGCNDLVFVFNRDIFDGELASISQIYPDKGQPWAQGEKMVCRKCGLSLNEKRLHFLLLNEKSKSTENQATNILKLVKKESE